jgi:hypothetical protein
LPQMTGKLRGNILSQLVFLQNDVQQAVGYLFESFRLFVVLRQSHHINVFFRFHAFFNRPGLYLTLFRIGLQDIIDLVGRYGHFFISLGLKITSFTIGNPDRKL